MNIKTLLLLALLSVFILSCEKDDGDLKQIKEINNFIYSNMTGNYYWTDEMPSIDPDKESDSKEYFNKLLYTKVDKWSFITDEYQDLLDYFDGIRKEMGYSIRPFKFIEDPNDKRAVAYVEFVYPNTPASRAGLKRGDMIVMVNGEQLDTENYVDLYYDESLVIGLGEIIEEDIVFLSPEIKLTAEVIQVDPILKTTVYNGLFSSTKVGYLAYTSFIDEFDTDLEQAIVELKADGISELILDLRYNSGGSVATANLLASLIGPASIEGEVFLKTDYNSYVTDYFVEVKNWVDEDFIDRFEGSTHTLDLQRLFVLTTEGTASASEMVMYTLAPYMEVIQIGEQTHGKYYGSITIDDPEADHGWAIQPIVMRAENTDNSIDYSQGLIPDYKIRDSYTTELGSSNDPMIAKALEIVYGSTEAESALKVAQEKMSMFKGLNRPQKHPLEKDMHINF